MIYSGGGNRLSSCISAFTLAEVLVTLGIIGIVAALTMPSLINNSQNRELQSALNKNYSVISQALDLMKADIGSDVNPADYDAREFFKNYKNYFKLISQSSSTGVLSGTQEEGDTSTLRVFAGYKTYSGIASLKNDIFDDGQILLPDGSLILIENNGYSGKIFITVDINGVNKKPNIWGRDLFTFEITSKGKLLPMGAEGTSYTNMSVYCSKNSKDTFNGIACTASALSDKDYFKKMY